jgi:hypothetical protein
VAPPVFKTGLAANIVAGGFDSLPPPPLLLPTKAKELSHGDDQTGEAAAAAILYS